VPNAQRVKPANGVPAPDPTLMADNTVHGSGPRPKSDKKKKKHNREKKSNSRHSSQRNVASHVPSIDSTEPEPSSIVAQAEPSNSTIESSRNDDEHRAMAHQGNELSISHGYVVERRQGKHCDRDNPCLRQSCCRITESCSCVKVKGLCQHSMVELNGYWFKVTDLTPTGTDGKQLAKQFPYEESLVRPRLRDVIMKMRAEPNAATEEALAKARGSKSWRSWRVRKANEALDREKREEQEEALKTRDRAPSAVAPYRTETVEIPNAVLQSEPQPTPSSLSSSHLLPASQTVDMSPKVSTTSSPASTTAHLKSILKRKSKYDEHIEANKRRKISSFSLPPQQRRRVSLFEQQVNIDHQHSIAACTSGKDGNAEQSQQLAAEEPRRPTSPSIVREAPKMAGIMPTRSLHHPHKSSDGIVIPAVPNDHQACRSSTTAGNPAGNSKKVATTILGKTVKLEPRPISLDSDSSDDEVEVTVPKTTHKLLTPHIRKSTTKLTGKTLDLESDPIEPRSDNEKPSTSPNPRKDGPDAQSGQPILRHNPQQALPKQITLAFIGKQVHAKTPNLIAVSGDLNEEVLSSSAKSKVSQIRMPQIQVAQSPACPARTAPRQRPHQHPEPITISSDSSDDSDTEQQLRWSNSATNTSQAQRSVQPSVAVVTTEKGTTTGPRAPQTAGRTTIAIAAQQSQGSSGIKLTPPATAKSAKPGTVWPEAIRGVIAGAAAEYLNALPENNQSPIDPSEIVKMLVEQPDFNTLYSEIRASGRTIAKQAFAKAILSKVPETAKQKASRSLPAKPPATNPQLQAVISPTTTAVGSKGKGPESSVEKNIVSRGSLHRSSMSGGQSCPSFRNKNATQKTSRQEVTTPQTALPSHRSHTNAAKTGNMEFTNTQTSSHAVPSPTESQPSGALKPVTTLLSKPQRPEILTSSTKMLARKDEVLDYVSKRLLLYDGFIGLPTLLKFIVEEVAFEECEEYAEECASLEREAAQKARILSEAQSQPQINTSSPAQISGYYSGIKRLRGKPSPPASSEDPTIRKRVRGRSTSPPVFLDPTLRKRVRGRSTTPPLYMDPTLVQRVRGRSTSLMILSRSLQTAVETEVENDDVFYDAEETLRPLSSRSDDFYDAEEDLDSGSGKHCLLLGQHLHNASGRRSPMVLVGGASVRKEEYVDLETDG
jgi:hypothetical protein